MMTIDEIEDAIAGHKITAEQVFTQMRQKIEIAGFEAIGWAYADCCIDLDKGKDPRKTEMSDVIERYKKDIVSQRLTNNAKTKDL